MSLRYSSGHCAQCTKVQRAERFSDPAKGAHEAAMRSARQERNRERRAMQARESARRNAEQRRERARAAYRANHAEELAKRAARRDRNREAVQLSARKSKIKLRSERPEVSRAYAREYYARNSVRIALRNRVNKALKACGVEKVKACAGYGIDVKAIADHLGPCPGKRSDWHIDHIRPLASFDFTDPAQIAEAFAPENHQWLPAKENLMKHAKYG